MLPERFIHDVQTPTDVQNINKPMPQKFPALPRLASGANACMILYV